MSVPNILYPTNELDKNGNQLCKPFIIGYSHFQGKRKTLTIERNGVFSSIVRAKPIINYGAQVQSPGGVQTILKKAVPIPLKIWDMIQEQKFLNFFHHRENVDSWNMQRRRHQMYFVLSHLNKMFIRTLVLMKIENVACLN